MDSTKSSYAALLSLLFLTFTNLLQLHSATRIASKLYHYNSIFSPNYNPNDTVADHAKYIERNSAARLAYIQLKVKTSLDSSHTIEAGLNADRGTFLVKFSIGQPPVAQLAVMDAGSRLIWVECNSCTSSTNQCFDSSKSLSYATTSCKAAKCDPLPRRSCDASNQCKFSITYENQFSTQGVLATEQFTFETFDEGKINVPNVSFGCSTSGSLSGMKFNGIFGLGGDSSTSLVTKLGNKFSYCIGNIKDQEYIYNRLVIGDGADIEGYSTPMETYKGFYYVSLEAVSIGDVRLELDPTVFKRTPDGNGGVIIDSGAEFSYLPEYEYNEICINIQNILDELLQQVIYEEEPWLMCYNGSVNQDLVGFPAVTFHFAEGAELVLDTGSLFYDKDPHAFCMAIHPVRSFEDIPEPDILPIIGVMAQQNYNVGYDLINQKLYLQRIDCQLLGD